MFSIQKGSVGAAVPLVTGAEHDVPRPATVNAEERMAANPANGFEREWERRMSVGSPAEGAED